MTADIYTKCKENVDSWHTLRRLVGIMTPEETQKGDFNPDVDQVAAIDPESVAAEVLDSGDLNTHYWCSIQGDSTWETDFRKPVKVKKPKAKAKKKPKPKWKDSVASPTDKGTHVIMHVQGGIRNSRAAQTMQGIAQAKNPSSIEVEDIPILKLNSQEKWRIILLCTDPGSYIERCNPFPAHCEIVNVTEQDDFTSEEGYQKVVKALREPRTALFISFPCTGGCLFNIGINAKIPKAQAKIQGHWKLFHKLWKSYERLCNEVNFVVPTVLEWPRYLSLIHI